MKDVCGAPSYRHPGLSFLYAFRIPSNTSIASRSVIKKHNKTHIETTNTQVQRKSRSPDFGLEN